MSDSPETDTPSTPPPGWHPDPTHASEWRWWDGQQWTEQRSPRQVDKKPNDNAALLGYVMSIVIPVVGFFIGLALIAGGSKEGGRITVLSLVFGFLWFLLATGRV